MHCEQNRFLPHAHAGEAGRACCQGLAVVRVAESVVTLGPSGKLLVIKVQRNVKWSGSADDKDR